MLHGPITNQVIFWGAKGTRMMQCWVEDHIETLELIYQVAATHATLEYTAQRLTEWRRRVTHTVTEFWANRLNLPQGTKRTRPTSGNPPFYGKGACL